MQNGVWIASNWWQLLSAFVLFVSYIVVIAKNLQTTRQMEKRIEALETQFDQHLLSIGLHRSPDFELRLEAIEDGLKTVHTILGQIQTDIRSLTRH